MDFSSEYVQMCQQAKEIQKFRLDRAQWDNGDFAYTGGDSTGNGIYSRGIRIVWQNLMVHAGYYNWTNHWYLPDDCIWLPRQDQLQSMITGNFKEIMDKENGFANGSYPFFPYLALSHFKSREQLLLGLIMKEEYDKFWNGSAWVKA